MRAATTHHSKTSPAAGRRKSARRARLEDPLLPRVAAGEPQAAHECIDRYGGLVWSLARQYCARVEDAEDCVQEIFLAVWRNAGRFDATRGREVAFVAMIARRRLIDAVRRRCRDADRVQRLIERTERADGADPVNSIETTPCDDRERSATLARAMDNLSEVQRRTIRLAIQGGMTHEQIADYCTMPIGTVKTHIRRGLLRLREILAPSDATFALEERGR